MPDIPKLTVALFNKQKNQDGYSHWSAMVRENYVVAFSICQQLTSAVPEPHLKEGFWLKL